MYILSVPKSACGIYIYIYMCVWYIDFFIRPNLNRLFHTVFSYWKLKYNSQFSCTLMIIIIVQVRSVFNLFDNNLQLFQCHFVIRILFYNSNISHLSLGIRNENKRNWIFFSLLLNLCFLWTLIYLTFLIIKRAKSVNWYLLVSFIFLILHLIIKDKNFLYKMFLSNFYCDLCYFNKIEVKLERAFESSMCVILCLS